MDQNSVGGLAVIEEVDETIGNNLNSTNLGPSPISIFSVLTHGDNAMVSFIMLDGNTIPILASATFDWSDIRNPNLIIHSSSDEWSTLTHDSDKISVGLKIGKNGTENIILECLVNQIYGTSNEFEIICKPMNAYKG